MNLPRLYPITDRKLTGLSHTEQVSRLAAGGATLIQLREKDLSSAEFYEDAARAVSLARASGVQIIINDRVDIALAVGSDGVHLGQNDLPPSEARKLLGPDRIIGFSTHSREQAADAAILPIDYVAFGPVFPTQTKSDPDPVVGAAELRAVRNVVGNLPLVAIGGISAENAASCFEAGADAVAMISGLLEEPGKITSRTSQLVNFVQQL